jgi:divalent metal cation (Fe/Co/Zn/Cd) transporter
VDSSLSVAEGHAIAEAVERVLCQQFGQVVDAIVHLEPYDDYQRAKTAEEIDAGFV